MEFRYEIWRLERSGPSIKSVNGNFVVYGWPLTKICSNVAFDDLCGKMHLFQALFLYFQIQQLAILRPVEIRKIYIPQKKALQCAFERSFETGRISVMKGSR